TFCVLAMGGIFSDKLQTKRYTSNLRKLSFEDESPPIANTMLPDVFFLDVNKFFVSVIVN
ncbi:MAG: hypothetical protein LC112_01310, partial [Flavobacteriales bacterium]|nr:hypothetical protein [Flavobacteriales bacterium]